MVNERDEEREKKNQKQKHKQKLKEVQVLKWNFAGVLNTISLGNGIKCSFTYTPPFDTSTDDSSDASFTFHLEQMLPMFVLVLSSSSSSFSLLLLSTSTSQTK